MITRSINFKMKQWYLAEMDILIFKDIDKHCGKNISAKD